MTELFEIGISLALSESVSSEIAKVQKEISGLSSALSAGGVSSERLRATAEAASAPIALAEVAERHVPQSTVETFTISATPNHLNTSQRPDPTDVGREPRLQKRETELLPRASSPQIPVLPEIFNPSNTDDDSDALRPAVAPIVPQHTFVVQKDPQRSPLALPQAHRPSLVPLRNSASPLELTTPRARPVDIKPVVAFQKANAPVVAAGYAPSVGSSQAVPSETREPESTQPADREMSAFKPVAPTQVNRQAGRGIAPSQDPRDAALELYRRPATSSAPTAPSEAPTAAGSARSEPSRQQIQGDVFLDGALVGRWLSRTLTRDAERASAGRTGFDVRRGRLLPGPTVGG